MFQGFSYWIYLLYYVCIEDMNNFVNEFCSSNTYLFDLKRKPGKTGIHFVGGAQS